MRAWVMKGLGLALGVVLIGGQGCPTGDSGGNGGDGLTVRMRLLAFDPPHITIDAGQTVLWRNDDLVVHTVTSGNPEDADAGALFDSGLLGFNDTFEHTFTEPGTFVYFCIPHAGHMRDATVTVRPTDPAAAAG